MSILMLLMTLAFQRALYAADVRKDRSAMKSVVRFTAKDSVVYNFDRRSMELWGKAKINDDDSSVKAPRIVIDGTTSLLRAFGTVDSSQSVAEPAMFSDRQGSFFAETMTYNFKTRRGETTHISSSSGAVKFKGDRVSRLENGDMVVRDGTFTTCDEIEPHYWFSSSSITFNPDTGIRAKPLYMYIRPEIFSMRLPAIPVMALPYMAFPAKRERISGFLMPTLASYSHSTALSNLGYYWAIDDYSDLRVAGDIAVNGSWRLGERFRYTKRDAFSGQITGEYKRYVVDAALPLSSEWNANIVHHQVFDASSQLDVALQFQGGKRHDDLNAINMETVLTEQTNSRASLVKSFHDENSIVTATYNRSADLRNHNDRQSTEATFYQNRHYPFRSGFSLEDESWRSAVSVTTGASLAVESLSLNNLSSSGYRGFAQGELGYYREFADGYNALLTQGISFQSVQPASGSGYRGTRMLFPLRMQSTLFHHLNINPSITSIHSLRTDGGESPFSTTVVSVDAGTRLYGTLGTGLFEHIVGLKALRHTFIPLISYTWNSPFSGHWYGAASSNVYDWPNATPFNNFEATRFTGVPAGQSVVGISLKNLLHGRFKGALSSEEGDVADGDRTVQLLSLTASTAYNGAVDAFRLAPLTVVTSSNVLAQNFLLSGGAMYDFYSYNTVTGDRVNRYNSDDGNALLRFVKGFMSMSLSLQGSRQAGSVASFASTHAAPFASYTDRTLFHEPFTASDWQLRFSFLLQTDKSNPLESTYDKLLNVSAKVAWSKNWQTGVNTGYDLGNGKVVFPMLQLHRDLHCWQMGFQWVPSGVFKGYAFQIGLKAL
ncbi:MAG: putative LPS assembly protein LptD [Chlorobium sp.]